MRSSEFECAPDCFGGQVDAEPDRRTFESVGKVRHPYALAVSLRDRG
jgi:hypothetical protein